MTVLTVIFTKCYFKIFFRQPRSQKQSMPVLESKMEKKNSLRRKCQAVTETNGKREKRLHEVAEQFKPPRNKVKEVSLMHFFLKKDF